MNTNYFFKLFILICFIFFAFSCKCKSSIQTIKTSKVEFQIYNYPDNDSFDDYFSLLIESADNIVKKYNPNFNKKVKIRFYNSSEDLVKSMHLKENSDWVVGCTYSDNEICLVNPYKTSRKTYNDMKKVLVHEFTHIVVRNLNKSVIRWLDEGIANYEAGQENSIEKCRERNQIAIAGNLPFFELLDDDMNSPDLYLFPSTIIEYIELKHSHEKLIQFIKNPNVEKVFGISKEDFQKEWEEYLKGKVE